MNNILSELEYENFILETLEKENGYVVRSSQKYDPTFAMDKEMLFVFLEKTQPKEMADLRKIFKSNYKETITNKINNYILQKNGSLIDLLKHGIEINGKKLKFLYPKVATSFNKELTEKYESNIFSVMKEVNISEKQRIDVVLFLNGFAICAIELKCEFAGQSYQDAIKQFRFERDEKNRLFMFKKGVLVCFAMDLNEVYMTTKLCGGATFFMPFNKGKGEGIDTGKGNPVVKDKLGVHYMWEDIFKKDTILDLITKFIFLQVSEETNQDTGEKTIKEALVFPRYHQLDCIRKILADVKENKSSQNYLIQHSAGSGKTNTIAWLAHRLSSFHDDDDNQIFDNIVIVTDRVVVDRQLQKAIKQIEYKSGKIKVMDEKCSSSDLKEALEGNTKIIATTIQKFPYIVDSVKGLKNKKFAVIIDEAHSSTAGKDMAAVNKALGSDENVKNLADKDCEDIIADELKKSGKRPNMSVFAFTATPKPTTLRLFGTTNAKGQKTAFHLYSMKQAIEEGYILDVLQSYTTYDTFYRLNKEIEDDPKFKTNSAKRKIARFVALHESNISQRVEIIIEHFRTTIKAELGGMAKAMVITSSREEAVKYKDAFNKYVKDKGYTDIHSLVAFSGKVVDKDTQQTFTESSLNGFSEDKTAREFDKDDYQVLIVANKYQTGYDQPKLCAMYILKTLKGVNAVQTLSRLNRICPPYDKKVFILDFMNDYDDIKKAFSPYYTCTILTNDVNPSSLYDHETKVDALLLFGADDVDGFNVHLYKNPITAQDKSRLNYYLERAKKKFDEIVDERKRKEAYTTLRRFLRCYEFLVQVTSLEDADLHKKYNFVSYLISYLKVNSEGAGFSLKDKITATNFVQKKNDSVSRKLKPNPVVKLPMTDTLAITEDKEKRLSEIIAEINLRSGGHFDNDDAIKIILSIRDLMKKDPSLRASAKNNNLKDFEFPYYDNAEKALLNVYSQHQELCTQLLNNNDELKAILGIFMPEIYKSLCDEYEKKDQ